VTLPDTTVMLRGAAGYFHSDVDLRPRKNVILRIVGSVDRANGTILVSLISLDPSTMLPSDDPAVGFLPPNVTPPGGEGSVAFVVSPRPGLAPGTPVANSATVTFDANAPITTPAWRNIIDSAAPQSNVGALVEHQDATRFLVSWSGSDAGSGISDYTIYARRDADTYFAWRYRTPAVADTFIADSSGTYAFYSVARDSAGNVEATPPIADATTTVGNVVGVREGESNAYPFKLWPASPNPFDERTMMRFQITESEDVRLFIFDISGRRVARLVDGRMDRGPHNVTWDGRDACGNRLALGVYFAWLQAGSRRDVRRLILVK